MTQHDDASTYDDLGRAVATAQAWDSGSQAVAPTPAFFTDHYDEAFELLAAMKRNSSSPAGLSAQLEANLTHDVLDDLEKINVPTLVTVGELDMCLPLHYSEELHRGIAGSVLHVFPGGSHLMGLQDPSEPPRVSRRLGRVSLDLMV